MRATRVSIPPRVRRLGAAIVSLALSSVAGLPTGALASDYSSVDPDGTLHVSALTIPPSDLWSPEFKAAYARLAQPPKGGYDYMPMPARNAPRVEWDKYDAQFDRDFSESLTWDLQRYPVKVVDTSIAGVHVGIISPKDGVPRRNLHRVLINLHGGGFVMGRGLVMGQLESIPVASIGGIKVITVDYREAPYSKYPAASEDVEAVYRELLKQYRPESIGVYGFAAGGYLTGQALAWFQCKRLPRPGAVGIFYAAPLGPDDAPEPWARTPGKGGGWGKGGDSRMWVYGFVPETEPSKGEEEFMEPFYHWYLEGVDVHDLTAYPGLSDTVLEHFPPTLFLSGTRSFDMSPVVVAHARFLKLGVDSSLYIMEGGIHGASEYSFVDTPEVHDAKAYVAHWFDIHLAR